MVRSLTELQRKFEETSNAGTVGKISYPFIMFTCIYTCVWLYSCFACMYVYISIYICIWLHVLYVYHKICTFSVHAFRSDFNKHLFCIHPTSYMDTVHAPSVSLYTLQELSERYAFATSSQGSIVSFSLEYLGSWQYEYPKIYARDSFLPTCSPLFGLRRPGGTWTQ